MNDIEILQMIDDLTREVEGVLLSLDDQRRDRFAADLRALVGPALDDDRWFNERVDAIITAQLDAEDCPF